ncbi:MAG TPA: hypothetical protein ENL34_03545 [Chloroflexi bacterium]|nr:hypothetical protein [Chloroflexota bacterium]
MTIAARNLAPPRVRLVVGGAELGDWASFDIESDLLQPADAFTFVAPNINGAMAGKVNQMDDVVVTVDDVVQMRGFVDSVQYANGQVQISGRDLFGHLVDCSAPPKSYRRVYLDVLAAKLSAPWDIAWQVDGVALKQHRWVKIEPGESCMDAIVRLAKVDRVLVWLDAQGVGHIGRPDYDQLPKHVLRRYKGTDPMSELNNVLEDGAEVSEDGRDRFSTITVLGSSGNSGSQWGKTALQNQSSTDAEVVSTRTLILTDGDVKSISACKQKAEDEVERRAFESVVIRYTTAGFYGEEASGQEPSMWAIDTRAAVTDQIAGLDGVYYVTKRNFQLELGQGHVTALELHQGGWLA